MSQSPTVGLAAVLNQLWASKLGSASCPSPPTIFTVQLLICTYMPKPEYCIVGWFSTQSGRIRAQNINKALYATEFLRLEDIISDFHPYIQSCNYKSLQAT